MIDVLVAGGGAAGMTAALFAKRGGAGSVVLLERNGRLGLKLGLTGKGRCNLTNHSEPRELIENIPANGRFLYSAFHFLGSEETMAMFEGMGVKLKVERGRRVFPASDRAMELVLALRSSLTEAGVKIHAGRRVSGIEPLAGGGFRVVCDTAEYSARRVIIATGGLSYPVTGSSGDGYGLAASLGHSISTTRPALVPLVTADPWTGRLQGLALRNVALHYPGGSELGEMLFTHFGISGPLVLTASGHVVDMLVLGPVALHIDLKPGLTDEQVDLRLQRDFSASSRRQLGNSLDSLLPRRLIETVIELSGIPAVKTVNQITREERQRLGALIKRFPVHVSGTRPIEEAIVTAGGVDTREIEPGTMQSRLRNGLYFAGEVIDVHGYTGGYNLQIAWSTGALAGASAAASLDSRSDGENL